MNLLSFPLPVTTAAVEHCFIFSDKAKKQTPDRNQEKAQNGKPPAESPLDLFHLGTAALGAVVGGFVLRLSRNINGVILGVGRNRNRLLVRRTVQTASAYGTEFTRGEIATVGTLFAGRTGR